MSVLVMSLFTLWCVNTKRHIAQNCIRRWKGVRRVGWNGGMLPQMSIRWSTGFQYGRFMISSVLIQLMDALLPSTEVYSSWGRRMVVRNNNTLVLYSWAIFGDCTNIFYNTGTVLFSILFRCRLLIYGRLLQLCGFPHIVWVGTRRSMQLAGTAESQHAHVDTPRENDKLLYLLLSKL